MKALAYQRGQMVEHNAVVIHATPDTVWRFEGQPISCVGVLGSRGVTNDFIHHLQRYRSFDSTHLQRVATYEMDETNWAVLFSVEGQGGIFYLRRMPGMVSSLIYHPLQNQRAMVVTHRSTNPKFYESDHVTSSQQALHRYLAKRK